MVGTTQTPDKGSSSHAICVICSGHSRATQALPGALPSGAAGRETHPEGLALGGGAGRSEPPLFGPPRKENPSHA